MKKRLISLVLALIMVVSLIPMGVLAEDEASADDIARQAGVYFDDAEWVALDGTPIRIIGTGGLSAEAYETVSDPAPETMTVLFEVKGVREGFTFGKCHWNTFAKGSETGITSNNSGNYSMGASATVKANGMYALQYQFSYINWISPLTFGKVTFLELFGGSRGVDFSTNDKNAQIRVVGLTEGPVKYDIVFCDVDGTEIGTASGSLAKSGGFRMDSVPALEDLYTGSVIPEKAETEQFKYEFAGWQTENGTPVDYANFSGKVYPRFNEIDKTKATITFVDGDGFVLDKQTIKIGEVAIYEGEVPTKSEDFDNTYVWTGEWDIDLAKVERDVTANATFTKVPKPKFVLTAPDGGAVKESEMTLSVNPINMFTDEDGDYTVTISYDGEIYSYKSCDDVAELVSDEDGTLILSLTKEAADGFGVVFDVSEEACTGTSKFVSDGEIVRGGETQKVYEYELAVPVAGILPGIYAEKDTSGTMVPHSIPTGEISLYKSDEYGKTSTRAYTIVFKLEGLDAPLTIGKLNMSATNVNGSDTNYWWSSNWTDKAYGYPSIISFPEDGIYYYTVNSLMGGYDGKMIRLRNLTASNFVSGEYEVGKNSENRAIAVPTEDSAALQSELNQNATIQVLAVLEGAYNPETRFYNVDGTELATVEHKYNDLSGQSWRVDFKEVLSYTDLYLMSNDLPTYSDPDKDYMEYTFAGWEYKDGTPATNAYKSAKVYAVYDVVDTRPDCAIKFVNYDDSVISDLIIKEGEMPAAPAIDPTKPHEELYSYIFQGWDADGDGEVDEIAAAAVDGATYKAVYKQVDRRWEVKFYAEDKETYLGSILVLGELKDGTTPTAPEKKATAQYTYTFDKWVDADGNELVETEVDADTIVYATYKSTVNQYTVTFLDEDGTELAKVTVDYGTAATTDAPVKAADEKYTYTFEKWDADTSSVVGDMTVTAVYSKEFTMFTDVKASAWYGDKVEYVINHGYMDGMGDGKFDPNGKTTRAQLVQVLYNMELRPNVDGLENPFTDVAEGQWYTAAIKWAYSKGIVAGMSPTTFEPNTPITRAQFCRILYGYSEKIHGYDTEIPKSSPVTIGIFKDKNSIPTWAQAEVKWCMYVGCISGYTESGVQYMKPNNNTTRAEMATILKLWDESDKLVVATTPAE